MMTAVIPSCKIRPGDNEVKTTANACHDGRIASSPRAPQTQRHVRMKSRGHFGPTGRRARPRRYATIARPPIPTAASPPSTFPRRRPTAAKSGSRPRSPRARGSSRVGASRTRKDLRLSISSRAARDGRDTCRDHCGRKPREYCISVRLLWPTLNDARTR